VYYEAKGEILRRTAQKRNAQFITVCRAVKRAYWRKKRDPGRGHYDKDRPVIIAWVSRQGGVVV
jgi:hypothetical protein